MNDLKKAIEEDKYYNNGKNIGLIMAIYYLSSSIKKFKDDCKKDI